MIKRTLFAAAVLAAAIMPATQAGAVTVVGATSITVRSALPDYLQVGELLAFDFGDVNVALATNGGLATAFSQYGPEGGPGETNDGAFPVSYDYANGPLPGVYHSAGSGSSEYLTISFAAATTLSRVTIYGRGDCGCQGRDRYNLTINGADGVLFEGVLNATVVDGPGLGGHATITFDEPEGGPPGVPEPASWALMLLGFGGAGAMLRRRGARPLLGA